jgi:signal transduction histidine kinase
VVNDIQEGEELYRQLLEDLPIAGYTCDAEGYLKLYNKAALNLWGIEPKIGEDKWCGFTRLYLLDGTSISFDECPMAIAIKEGRIVNAGEIIAEGADGTRFNLVPHPKLIKDKAGTIVGAINMLVDVTVPKTTDKRTAELVTANRELSLQNEENKKLALGLIIANKELEAFSYVSSHDLQEPLRKIQAFSGLILETESKNLSERGKDYFNRILLAAARMRLLIDNLLAYSRLNIVERTFENTELNKIVEEVKTELEQIIKEKRATIEAIELCKANVIPFQFRQIMHNLISNALKFSNPDIPPHIIIKSRIIKGSKSNEETLLSETKYCHISVSDNGIGFDPQYKERIFEAFQRLHSQAEYSGTGVGLAIVKKVVDNHNGIVKVTSKLDEGSTFNIYIPVS